MSTETAPVETMDLAALRQAFTTEVSRMCLGGRWLMSVPARPGYDSDLIIDAYASALEAELGKARAALRAIDSEDVR